MAGSLLQKKGEHATAAGHFMTLAAKGVAVDMPREMCPSLDGGFKVTDWANHRIRKVYFDGRATVTVVEFDDGTEPYGIARLLDTDDYIVTDVGNHRVLRIDTHANIKWASGRHGCGRDQFDWPFDVKVLPDRRIVVSDFNNNRLQLLDPDSGHVTGTIKPSGPHAFNCPIGVGLDSAGLIYVVDQGNHRVVVVTPDGSVVRTLGTAGRGPGQLNTPCGVAVGAEGHVLVADQANNRVVVFGPDGNVTHIETPQEPWGVLIDDRGAVYISGGDHTTSFVLCVGLGVGGGGGGGTSSSASST